MKIALINSLYKPYKRGGAEVVFNNIVNELKKNDHDVFVITISKKKNKKKYYCKEVDGVKVYRFYPLNIFSFIDIDKQPKWKRLIWHLIDTFNWHSYWQVKKILKKEQPDLVLTHNLKGISYQILKAIKKLKIKNVHTLHDVQLVEPSGLISGSQFKEKFYNKLYIKIIKKIFDCPQIIVSPSKWLMKFYRNYGFFEKSKRYVIPNPLIIDNICTRKEFADNDSMNFLFIGQLESHKGILFLLQVFEEFVKNNNAHLYIVGQGSLSQVLQHKYQDKKWLDFMGYVPYQKLQNVFSKVHYTIVSSLCIENSPGVVFDSFKNCTPVIASAIGGIPEIVQEGVNGYLFEPGNKYNLLNKLNSCLTNKEHFSLLSENAKIKAAEYDIKKYVYRILNL